MADTQEPQIGKDAETQQMVRDAQQNYPTLSSNDAIQAEADKGPGREARVGEAGATGIVNRMKDSVGSAVESVKQMNPATRDMHEKHC